MLLSAAVLAGCGGGPAGPTATEKRAALDKWTRTADAACEKANDAIAKRGWPVNLVDLDRLTVRAIADVAGRLQDDPRAEAAGRLGEEGASRSWRASRSSTPR